MATWSRYPIWPWLSAPHTSRGMGATEPLAASCCNRIRPTCGPLPCVTTTSQPAAAMAATRSAANRAERRMFSAVSSFPRRSNAFPPNATTTRFTAEPYEPVRGARTSSMVGDPSDSWSS